MVKVVKSAVKCYKKKTKKTVSGKRKIYEYNQYLVPLKRSDNFDCSQDVFIIPQDEVQELVGEDLSVAEDFLKNLDVSGRNVDIYERELAELEWKHNELSKSYKELVSKHTKTNKKLRLEGERIAVLEGEKKKLMNKLEEIGEVYRTLKKNHQLETEKNKILEEELKIQKDKDIWTSFKSRLGSKKDGEE